MLRCGAGLARLLASRTRSQPADDARGCPSDLAVGVE